MADSTSRALASGDQMLLYRESLLEMLLDRVGESVQIVSMTEFRLTP